MDNKGFYWNNNDLLNNFDDNFDFNLKIKIVIIL